jgi:tRNA-splicing ligase RtcB (3'-phosphate/5'-hydroxy nucleic acid ligase)
MITGKILKLRGWPEGRIIGLAKAAAAGLAKTETDQEAILLSLDLVRMMPAEYLNDPLLGDLARECLRRAQPKLETEDLRAQPLSYQAWGVNQIDAGALAQMENALRLPIAVAGALMPDAHVGYGLPIGGVLATDNAVIPFAVGVDIACRMRLSIYEAPPEILGQHKEQFSRALMDQTRFGSGAAWEKANCPSHQVLDDPAWSETPLLRSLQSKAQEQLGTSGTGNHFVEWGILRLHANAPDLNLKAGEYLALLSHSGSRGVGFKIANTYTEIARRLHPLLDQLLRHLSWLPLDAEAGQEYWVSMELAGRFASANHYVIHHRVAGAVLLKEIAHIENHHNFAWSEALPDAPNAIVHRKGATPAGPGVLGVIPGSMGDAGYLVRGKGAVKALNSAAHGAGRKMSRRGALQSISKKERDTYLRERGITLLGGGLDESPQAYKNIEEVMIAQDDLIEIVGKFTPRIVRMANESGDI